ncbi:MAG: DUF1599 domain-containing protein [Ruminococcus flavefaciens]|nr:DUF1599 domain-containing protein [Ruminococcus flavefaciens]
MDKLEVHASICDGIKDLYRRKNADYGDSFAKARKVVPNYTLGKLYDKFSRYMNLSIAGEDTAQVAESLDDTLLDLANYAIMELTERRLERKE